MWVFKAAETINNPMGLCRFYCTSPKKSNVLTGPKSADCTRKIQGMVELAKGVRQPLTVVVFEGELVTPVCLLQDLHLCLTLSHIAIHTPEEAKVGLMNHVSCCPICAYVVKNNNSFLNHIIVRHYQSSFSCGKCLKFMVADAQQMRRHIADCGVPQKERKKKRSTHNKAPEARSSSRSGHKSKKAKKKKTDKEGIGVQWNGKSHAVHQPSLVWRPLLRSRLPILRVMVHARPPPSLVTSRCPRSRRSQRGPNRVFALVRESVWCAMMF